MTDTSLSILDRARLHADPDSWEKLAATYTPILHAWLGRYELQPSDADDVVQEVLMVVSRELPQFRHSGQRGAFRSWLRTILVHRLRKSWRDREFRPIAFGGSAFLRQLNQLEDPQSELSRQWNREHDRHLLGQLVVQIGSRFSETTLQAFRRVVIDGIDAEQVARELDLTLNAVLIAKCRVLKELRREGRGLLGD